MKGLIICIVCIGLFSLIFFPLSCELSKIPTPAEIQASEARKTKEKSTIDKVVPLAFLAVISAVFARNLYSDIKSGMKKEGEAQTQATEIEIMKCPNCNHELSGTQKFCSNCGTQLSRTLSSHSEPGTPAMSNGQLLGVLGLVSGIIGIFIFPVVFGPAAIVLGILSLNKQKNKLAWTGIVLGGLLVLITGIAFINALT